MFGYFTYIVFVLDVIYAIIFVSIVIFFFIETQFVYSNHSFASCTVLFNEMGFLFYVQNVFYMKVLCALWRHNT